MNTAEKLKKIRGELTQAEFASRLGLHKNTLGRYERGESEPDFGVLRRVCSEFDVSPEWLLKDQLPIYEFEKKNFESENSIRSESSQVVPQNNSEKPYFSTLEQELATERAERRDLAAENRELWRKNAKLEREVGELRAQVARLEERSHRLSVATDQPAANSGAA